MLHRPDESDEHMVRRLEAFSDVVIGFSLAELALTLNIPGKFSQLLGNPAWIVAYLWTFSTVCYLWFEHHRLFARIFTPRTLSMLLNFAWLATVGLIVYLVQLFTHFETDLFAVKTTYEWYFAAFGLNMLILSLLYVLGVREHALLIAPQALLRLRETIVRFAIAGGVVLVIVAASPLMSTGWFFFMVPASITYGFVIAGLVVRSSRIRR